MSGNPSYLVPRSSPYNQTTPTSAFPGCNIPQEDLDHAWALVRKYPPQIVIWIIRELLSRQSPLGNRFALPTNNSHRTTNGYDLLRDTNLTLRAYVVFRVNCSYDAWFGSQCHQYTTFQSRFTLPRLWRPRSYPKWYSDQQISPNTKPPRGIERFQDCE